ncbi:MAG: four helix bundle protein [Ignavibacteria bacterium]|nr:four helix bundle protein [Ignavibacteria bacterium]
MPIWIVSMKLAESIFFITENLPKKEDYGFTSQIRRAALSISANLAESFGRNHSADKINFLYFSRGSITETQSHLEYGKRVGYINEIEAAKLDLILDGIHKDINKIIVTLKNSRPKN